MHQGSPLFTLSRSPTVIHLLPNAIFTPSIQPNLLGLPRRKTHQHPSARIYSRHVSKPNSLIHIYTCKHPFYTRSSTHLFIPNSIHWQAVRLSTSLHNAGVPCNVNYTSIKIWQYVCYIVLFPDVSEKFETFYRTTVSVRWSSLGSLSQQRVVRGMKWTFLLCEEKVNHVEYGQPGMLEASFMVVGLHMRGLDQRLKILRC